MKMPLELSHFKKVSEDDHTATLQHPQGHEIKIAKRILSPKMKKDLASMPMAKFAEGGEVGGQLLASNSPPSWTDTPSYDQAVDAQTPQPTFTSIPHAPEGYAAPPTADTITDQSASPTPPPTDPGLPPPATDMSPPTSPATTGSTPGTPSVGSGYNMEMAGLASQAKAEGALGKAQAKILDQAAVQQKTAMDHYNDANAQLTSERSAFMQDYQNQHIDPNHFLASKGVGDRIATGVGLVLSGIGSALAGQPNMAETFLQKQIDADIEAQKAELGKKDNLLSANMKQFGNLRDATAMTQSMQADVVKAQIQSAAAKSTDPLAQSRALQAMGALDAKYAPQFQQLAMRQALERGSTAGADPSEYVRYVVPETHQKAVFEEIQRAQNTRNMSTNIMASFDQAAKDNTVMRTGGGMLRTPASALALHQNLQPTFADIEHTVRQAAMDNTFKNVTPAPGDSADTIATKRATLAQYLESKKSAPTAKGFGIDLDKFQSTSSNPMMSLPPQHQAFAKWAMANPSDPRAQATLQKLGIKQ